MPIFLKKFTRKDLFFSLGSGILTGFIAWKLIESLNAPKIFGDSYLWLVVAIPLLWIVGVNFGYFLGQWLSFFNQFGKFVAIGFTNAAVDFGVLNLLIVSSGIYSGIYFSVFKAISFISAIIPSYFWNKYWTFNAGDSGGGGAEFFKFASVAIIAILVNNAAASLVVNFIDPVFNLSPQIWANVGAVIGSASALIFSFIGFRLAVFKN